MGFFQILETSCYRTCWQVCQPRILFFSFFFFCTLYIRQIACYSTYYFLDHPQSSSTIWLMGWILLRDLSLFVWSSCETQFLLDSVILLVMLQIFNMIRSRYSVLYPHVRNPPRCEGISSLQPVCNRLISSETKTH